MSSVASSRPYQGGNRIFIGVFALVVRERSDGSRTKVWRKSDEFYFVKSTLIQKNLKTNEQKKFAFFGKSVAMFKDMDTAHVPPGERELH